MKTFVVTSVNSLLCHASTCFRIGSKFRCIRSTPTSFAALTKTRCTLLTQFFGPVSVPPCSPFSGEQVTKGELSRSRNRATGFFSKTSLYGKREALEEGAEKSTSCAAFGGGGFWKTPFRSPTS